MTARKSDSLSNEDLLQRIDSVMQNRRRQTAQLIGLLLQLDESREHLRIAYSSLYEFCVRRLGMSEGTAYRHITATRLAHDCPKLLTYIENGDIHLSRIAQLRHVIKPKNVDELVETTRGMSKYQVEELVRRLDPRVDVPGRMRKLPTLRTDSEVAPAVKPRIEPHAESRYRLQATISRELRDKIERALDLMSHANPKRDLTMLLERAVDALLEKLEKRRLGKTSSTEPSAEPSAPTPAPKKDQTTKGNPSRATRRRGFNLDDEPSTLDVGQIIPPAKGGMDDGDNLRVRSRQRSASRRLRAA